MSQVVRSNLVLNSAVVLAGLTFAACTPQENSKQSAPADNTTTKAAAQPSSTASSVSEAAPAPAATASASASATAEVDEGPPVCQRSNEKVWGSGTNKLTGLTTKGFEAGVAVGFAFGNDPRVLVVAKDGSTKMMKVKQGDKAKLPDAKEGIRFLMRVSPSDISGSEARAFIDYRDEFTGKEGRKLNRSSSRHPQ